MLPAKVLTKKCAREHVACDEERDCSDPDRLLQKQLATHHQSPKFDSHALG